MVKLGFGACNGFEFIEEGCFKLLIRRKSVNLGTNLGWNWIEERDLAMLGGG